MQDERFSFDHPLSFIPSKEELFQGYLNDVSAPFSTLLTELIQVKRLKNIVNATRRQLTGGKILSWTTSKVKLSK